MKPRWNNDEIKKLFVLVENNNKKNISALNSFKMYAKISKRNAYSIRNFYYDYVKVLKNNPELCESMGIDITKHNIEKFEHFNNASATEMKEKVDSLKNEGLSTRNACFKLSGGDIKMMLRLQNKYRNITSKNCKVFKFPEKQIENNIETTSHKLTDDEIKSLFMGLVKLVKESAESDSKQSAKEYIAVAEEEKRKELVAMEQKQEEIVKLQSALKTLKMQNNHLNERLKRYRIDYVQKYEQPNDNNI